LYKLFEINKLAGRKKVVLNYLVSCKIKKNKRVIIHKVLNKINKKISKEMRIKKELKKSNCCNFATS
jgi:hypothetical protein